MPKLVPSRELRILDFDIETRRVGFYTAGRFAPDGAEPVAIAWSFLDSDTIRIHSLNTEWSESRMNHMLSEFVRAYDQADVVTGHYIRKFDLPILNAAMLEFGFAALEPKLAIDTKTDLITFAGLSKSQENLAALLQLDEEKFHWNDVELRAISRLTPRALHIVRTRVASDVRQHKALFPALRDAGYLNAPEVWKP